MLNLFSNLYFIHIRSISKHWNFLDISIPDYLSLINTVFVRGVWSFDSISFCQKFRSSFSTLFDDAIQISIATHSYAETYKSKSMSHYCDSDCLLPRFYARIIKRQFDVCQGVYETNLSADWINPLINETHSILTRFEPSLKIMLDG